MIPAEGKASLLALLAVVYIVLFTSRAPAQPGSLDLTLSANAAGLNSEVRDIAFASDGKIIVGGWFSTLSGLPRSGVARLLSEGSVDAGFAPTVAGQVDALAVDASNGVIIGGYFQQVNGTARTNLARINADGTLDPGFQTMVPLQVQALGIQPSGKVLVGGAFTSVTGGGASGDRFGITRLNPDGSDDGSFANRGFRLNVGGANCYKILIQPDGKILALGTFDTFDGTSVSNLVRLNEDTTLDTTFRADFSGSAIAIALQPDGKVLIAGSITHSDGITRPMARLNLDGTLDESFSTEAEAYRVYEITVDADSRIYIGGRFGFLNIPNLDGFKRSGIARFYPNGALDTTFDPGTGVGAAAVSALAVQANRDVVVGGNFTAYNGQSLRCLARVFGGSIAPAPPAIVIQPTNRTVNAGASTNLLVGAIGHPQPHFQWQFNGTNIPGATRSRYMISYVTPEHAGTYTAVISNELGVVMSNPAVLSVNTYPPGFARQPTNQVLIEGQNLRMLCVVTGAPFPSLQWQLNGADVPGANASSFAVTNVTLAHAGPYRLVASNAFGFATSEVAQVTINPAATIAGAVDVTFVPQLPSGPSIYPLRAAVMQPDGKIVVAGDQGRLWRWLPDGLLDPSFTNSSTVGVEALALQSDGGIVVGRSVGAQIIRLHSNGLVDTNFQFSTTTAGVKALVVQPDGRIVYAANAPSSGGPIFGRILSNGAPDPNFRTLVFEAAQGGVQETPVTSYGLLLQPDGKVILASSLVGIWRFLPNGARDLSFRSFNLGVPVNALSMALQNDGKLVLGWHGNNDIVNFVRLNEDGTRDPGFAPSLGGIPGGLGGPIYNLTLQPDGKTVAVGVLTNRTRLMRFNTDGTLDAGFAVGEIVANPNQLNPFFRIFLDPACKPTVVGTVMRLGDYEREGAFRVLGGQPSPPLVVRPPASLAVHRGQIARFSADVTCPPAPSYHWFFQETPIPGETRPWLTITNVETLDAGNYSLSVTNALGSVSSAVATLTVNPAPTNNGAVDVDFRPPVPNDAVLGTVRQPDGKLLIAGNFTKVGTNERAFVARLHADGSLDEAFDAGSITNTALDYLNWGPAVISALALQDDGAILVGGRFNRIGGQSRTNLARLHPDGSVDTNFFATGNLVSPVTVVAVQRDGKILYCQTYNVRAIQRLNTNGAVESTFPILFFSGNPNIKRIALQSDQKILVAGNFILSGSNPRTGFMRLLTNGQVDATLPNIQAGVEAFALLPQAIVIGGTFNTIRGVQQQYLAALDYSGAVLTNVWRPVLNQPVRALIKDDFDRIIVAGSFTNASGPNGYRLLRFLPDGSVDPTFTPPVFNSQVRALATIDDAGIIAAGDSTEVNGVYRPALARLFETGLTVPHFLYQPTNVATVSGRDFTLGATVITRPGSTYQWQLNGVDIFGATNTTITIRNAGSPQAGGYQLIASNQFGMSTSAVATVTVSPAPRQPGHNDVDFYPDLTNSQRVTAMALQPDGKLLASHGPPGAATRLRRYQANGTRDLSFNSNSSISNAADLAVTPSGNILVATPTALRCLSANGATILFGISYPAGFLSHIVLQPDGKIILSDRFTVRRFNASGGIDPSFVQASFDRAVTGMVLQRDGRLLVGGYFTNVSSVRSPAIVRLNTNGTQDASFTSGFPLDSVVFAVAVQSDGRIVLAGGFTNYAGYPRQNVVRLHSNGEIDTSFEPTLPGTPSQVAVQPDGKVLLAGRFDPAALPRGVVRLLADGSSDTNFQSGPVSFDTASITELILAPDGDIYVGNGFFNYDGFTRFGLARLHGNPVVLGPAYSEGTFSTSLVTDAGRAYHLESTASLDEPQWTVEQTLTGDGSLQIFSTSPAGPARYYRVRAD